jgi:hypothetical protein
MRQLSEDELRAKLSDLIRQYAWLTRTPLITLSLSHYHRYWLLVLITFFETWIAREKALQQQLRGIM